MVDEIKRPETGAGHVEAAREFSPVEKTGQAPSVEMARQGPRALGVAAEPDPEKEQKVTVKALKHFPKHGDPQGEHVTPGDSFETTRRRAVELRANGLIEYVETGSGAEPKHVSERIDRIVEGGKLKDKDKATPLRNPKLEFADVDETQTAAASKSKKSGN